MKRAKLTVLLTVVAVFAAPAVASALSPSQPAPAPRSGSLLKASPFAPHGMTHLGASPGNPITNPSTHTLYVALQCENPNTNKSCVHTASQVLEVFDSNHCKSGASCKLVAKAAAGKSPLAEAIDFKTDTIYVGGAAGTVTVVNGARCNASVTSGCRKPLATIKTGGLVPSLAFNPKTRTVYAANVSSSGGVFVIDVSACNRLSTKGCGRPVKKVQDPQLPGAVAVDVATNTVYAANGGPNGNGHTVSIINGATCNGTNHNGCGQTPHTIKVGHNPFWDVVDQATDTVYVPNFADGTVSIINGAKCNATTTSGCKSPAPTLQTGAGAAFVVVDQTRHTLFAINQGDDTLSAINTKTCNGKTPSGCPKRARNEQARFKPPYGYNPNAFALTPHTGTAYPVNVGGEPFLSAINTNHCNAQLTSGCRAEAPTVAKHEFLISVDRATNTIYAGNTDQPQIDVINGATCKAGHLSGCKTLATIPTPHPFANVGAIDDATHTLYSADTFGNTISAINLAHCKVGDTSGCHATAATLTVGPGPGPPVLNHKTRTLYAPDGPKSNLVAVINASTCNATHTSGCGQTPAQVPVGGGTFAIALSEAKNTVYTATSGFGTSTLGHIVAVINGATCNATNHSGCGHPAAKVRVGLAPIGVAVNDHTHTVYVANNANGDLPGTASLIDTNKCNGAHTARCTAHWPTAPTGRSPEGVAIDPTTDSIYIGDFSSAAVSVLNGATCRAGHSGGCAKSVREQPVGSQPSQPAVNPATHSVLVPNGLSPGTLSIFSTGP